MTRPTPAQTFIPQAQANGMYLTPKVQKHRAEHLDSMRREINYRAAQLSREDWAAKPDCEEKASVLKALRGSRLTDEETLRVWAWMGGKA